MSSLPSRRIVFERSQGGAHNDVQLIAALASVAQGDWFTLTYLNGLTDTETTAHIVATADPLIAASQVQGALEALNGIEVGDVTVTGSDSLGFTVEFMGKLGFQAVPLLVIALNGMTGGTVSHGTIGYDLTSVGDRDQVNTISISDGSSTDSFTITFFDAATDKQTTGSINWAATAAQVKTAIIALKDFATEDITVTGAGTVADPFKITFGGKFAGQAVPIEATGTGCTPVVFELVAAGGHEGDSVDVTGTQMVIFITAQAPDEAAGVLQWEVSHDGQEWAAFDVTRASTATVDSETSAAEVGDAYYAQTPDGPTFVRASYDGTPFTSEAPLVSVLAF